MQAQKVRTRKARVIRLMRGASLLAPTRGGRAHGPKAHDNTTTPHQPDQMRKEDATATLTGQGQPTVFIGVDHCT